MPRSFKLAAFLAASTPFLWLLFRTLTGRLGVNQVEDLQLTTGIWALRFLLIALSITPLRRITGWNAVIQLRRQMGLFAFFYATLHMLTYLVFDQFFDLAGIVADVAKRPFIMFGMVAFLMLIPLAVTSTKGWIRRLGRKWQLLHRLVYVAAIAACLHFLWKVKVMVGEPVYYALILAVLLAFRLVWRMRPTSRIRQTARA